MALRQGRKRHWTLGALAYVGRRFNNGKIRPLDKPHVIVVGSVGARVVPVSGRRGKSFWIRVGRVRVGSYPLEIAHGLYAKDLLHLPQLSCRVASYLARQALVDPRARRELTPFVVRWLDAKWNGVYPAPVRQWRVK